MRAIGLILGLGLAGEASAQTPPIPPLSAVSIGPQGLTVRISLDGCPAPKANLTLAVEKSERAPLVLIARRRSGAPIACLVPGSSEVTWSLDELGLAPGQAFNLANPLANGLQGPPR